MSLIDRVIHDHKMTFPIFEQALSSHHGTSSIVSILMSYTRTDMEIAENGTNETCLYLQTIQKIYVHIYHTIINENLKNENFRE